MMQRLILFIDIHSVSQHAGAGLLVMSVVRVVHGEHAEFAGDVPNVVQQRSGDSGFALTGLPGQPEALQHVLGHGDRFTNILLASPAPKDVSQKTDDRIPGRPAQATLCMV